MTIQHSDSISAPNSSRASAYFFIFSILEGFQRLSGLFYFETLQFSGLTRQSAAIPFTLSRAVANVIGPLIRQASRNKNPGCVILLGTLLSATGIALCILSNSLTHLLIFWGLIFGVGYAVVSHHQPAVLKISNNLEMMSACATGYFLISILLALLLDALIPNYGIQGSFIIMSGIILHYLPLELAASYNIKISLPIMKWRVRKRNSKYSISEQKGDDDCASCSTYPRIINISRESLVHSLEPDILRKMTVSDGSQSSKGRDSSILESRPEVSLNSSQSNKEDGDEMTEKEIDLKSIIDKHIIPGNRILSEVILDVQAYEKRRNMFEDSFSQPQDIEAMTCDKKVSDLTVTESSTTTNNPVSSTLTNNTPEICVVDLEQTEEHLTLGNEEAVSNPVVNVVTHSTKLRNKRCASSKETLQSQRSNLPKTLVPLDIKVRVVECTFASNTDCWNEEQTQKPRKGYRRHSNSIPLGCYDNIDFTNPTFFKKGANYSELNKLHLNLTPNIYSISEEVELTSGKKECVHNNREVLKPPNVRNHVLITKSKEIFQKVNRVAAPVWICVLLISVIYEFSLTTLILIFADFAKDIDSNCSDFKWILIAFGIGGITGRLFFNKVEKQLLEKPYAADTVLFMLNGLVTAGILWSPDLNWLAGFYCFLGALEVGTSDTVSRLISDYISLDSQTTLHSLCKIWSGFAVLTIPYAIGSTRDDFGEYELLLQGISCSLVVSAILCYFLPRMTQISKNNRNQV